MGGEERGRTRLVAALPNKPYRIPPRTASTLCTPLFSFPSFPYHCFRRRSKETERGSHSQRDWCGNWEILALIKSSKYLENSWNLSVGMWKKWCESGVDWSVLLNWFWRWHGRGNKCLFGRVLESELKIIWHFCLIKLGNILNYGFCVETKNGIYFKFFCVKCQENGKFNKFLDCFCKLWMCTTVR